MTGPTNPDEAFNVGLPITLGDLRQHLNLSAWLGGDSQTLLRSKILAATKHVEARLGLPLSAFEGEIPEDVLEAIRLVAGHLYENREQVIVGQGIDAQELPTVGDLLSAHKRWVF